MSFGMAYATKKRGKKMAAVGEMKPAPTAEGGEIESAMPGEESDRDMLDMVGRVMKHHYSKGGQVANDVGVAEADEKPAEFDDLVLEDDDLSMADESGENSGDEDGDPAEDKRDEDVVSKVMSSRKKKDKMPRPA